MKDGSLRIVHPVGSCLIQSNHVDIQPACLLALCATRCSGKVSASSKLSLSVLLSTMEEQMVPRKLICSKVSTDKIRSCFLSAMEMSTDVLTALLDIEPHRSTDGA